MERKLFSNLKRITMLFSIFILLITLVILLLRLTVLSDKVENNLEHSIAVPTVQTAAQYNIQVERKITFDNAKSNGSFKILFPKDSPFSLRFRIILKETGKEVYQSKLITPGDKSLNIKLSKTDLSAGEYECIVEFTTYELETEQKQNTFEEPITIHIKG